MLESSIELSQGFNLRAAAAIVQKSANEVSVGTRYLHTLVLIAVSSLLPENSVDSTSIENSSRYAHTRELDLHVCNYTPSLNSTQR